MVQYSTVQYITVQYSTAQYSTVQYSTLQYSRQAGNAGAYQGLNLELHDPEAFPVSCSVLCQLLLQVSLQTRSRLRVEHCCTGNCLARVLACKLSEAHEASRPFSQPS